MAIFKIIGATALLATASFAREAYRIGDAIINKREKGDETFAKLDKNNPSLNKATALKQEMYKNWNKLNQEMKNQTGTSPSDFLDKISETEDACYKKFKQRADDIAKNKINQFKSKPEESSSDLTKRLANEKRQINQEVKKLTKDYQNERSSKLTSLCSDFLDTISTATIPQKQENTKTAISYIESAEEYVNFTRKAFARQEKEKMKIAKDLRITNLEQDLKNAEPVHHADFLELGAAMAITGELWTSTGLE